MMNTKIMQVLVIGANGLVGSNLVNELENSGTHVRAFDRYSRPPAFEKSDLVEIFSGDFYSTASLRLALSGISKVVIATGASSPAASENDPILDIEHTLMPTVRLLELCVEEQIEEVYFCSSGGAIYGEIDADQLFNVETDQAAPISPYGISKLAIEGYLRYFFKKHGLRSITFRISNVFGSPIRFVRGQGLIPAVLLNAVNGLPVKRMGSGSSIRDFIYAKDLSKMMTKVILGNPTYSLYNLGSGRGRSINSVIDTIETVTNKEFSIEEVDSPKTFLARQVLSIERFSEEFGTFNFSSFETAISELWSVVSAPK